MSEPNAKRVKGTTICFPDSIIELYILSFPRDGWGVLMLVNERMHHLVTGVARRKGLEGVPEIDMLYAALSDDCWDYVYSSENTSCPRYYYSHYGLLRSLKRLSVNQMDHYTTQLAADNGHIECLRYADEMGCGWSWEASDRAAMNGHLECLQYVLSRTGSFGYATDVAALGGSLECLKCAFKHEGGWTVWTATHAMMGGNLDCLRYAHENGCSWDKNSTSHAVKNQKWECLEYAISHGCPYTEETKRSAIENGFTWPDVE